ncbi:hypothetical protein [Methanoculleus sp. 7T]|jgi:hypothetical protein|uniref:hypothetical protein n=1 Tax=Methanoculleus sp. 7T TaxID=2937282 RepID=UPI0020C147D7|nr:hypothetical protein [Methanoculleus sp. 7T]MCK8518635.1 hypothetical protein [Methanoculleus sp. 7T]
MRRTDDGVLSLDFLAGFTIFMLALIMVVSMVPGLLAGLESSGIDYDAVAYRTGVILVEDPGWPVYPPWELYDRDHKDEIERMGLAVSKDTPNILLSTKVERFFENASTDDPFFTEDDYRSKVIFGDYPYSYSVSLRSEDGTYNNRTGDPLPLGYGYIRRVVKIKEPGVTEIVGVQGPPYWTNSPTSPTQTFTVQLNFSQLLNQSVGPAYRIDPRIEPVNVTITNFGAYLNQTVPAAENATLRSVTFWKMDPTRPNPRFTRIPFSYDTVDPDLYTLRINGASEPHSLKPDVPVESSISLVLKPAATSVFTLDQNSILDIRFTFEDDPPRALINGTHLYDYRNVTRTDLKTGVLEVAVW